MTIIFSEIGSVSRDRQQLVHACHFVTDDAQSCIQTIGKIYQPIDAEKCRISM